MIKIFNVNDKIFNTAGEITINPIKCIEFKKKSLNGWYLEVEIPIKYKNYIEKDKLCVVKTKSKLNPQAFRISDNIQYTNRKISFTANHVLFDSKDYILDDVRPVKLNGINSLNYINERTDNISPFNIFSNVENINTAYFIRKNLLEAWEIIEERWNGIFDADNWNISFLNTVGNDNGESIVYGKNMQAFNIYEDWSNVVTKIYPVGYDGITLPSKYISSDIQYEKPYSKVIHFETDLEVSEVTEADLIEELRVKAISYLEENKVPKINYTINSDVNQTMEIGDIISVLHPLVNIKTEVLEYEYDIILEKVKTLVFGNFIRDVKSKFDNIKNTIEKISNNLSKQEVIIRNQTDLINTLNKNGYVYVDDNEILILDKLPKETAKNVWRFGLGGIGFSSNGIEGPFEIAITQDGQINAKFISTGKMSVDRIEGLGEQITTIVQKMQQVENTANEALNNTITIDNIEKQKDVRIQASEGVLQNVEIYGKSIQNEEPSINNPSPIISVGSNKNLLDLEDVSETTTAKGITYSVKNGIFTLNGTSTGSHYIIFPKIFSLKKGTYTYSTTVVSGELGGTANLGKQLNNGSELLFNAGNILDIATTTITEDANEVKCSFYVGSSVVFNNFKVKLKLEEGNKVTGYTNYNCGGIDYKTIGKNKLDLNKITLSSNIILNDTGITINNLWGTPILSNQKVLEMFKANTKYICTAKVKVVNKPTILSTSYNHNRILLLNKTGGTNIEVLSSNQKNSWNVEETHELKIEFTTPQDLVGYRLLAYTYFGKNDEGSADAGLGIFEITDLMIREANIKDNNFELYKEIVETIQLSPNIELCSAGDTQDYIDSSGVIHKKTKKIVLNGTENWYIYANYTGEGYCYYLEDSSFPLLQINNKKYKHSICTHFKNVYATWMNGAIGTYSDHAAVHRKYFVTDKATLDEFKTWLANNTPKLLYQIVTEDISQTLSETEIEKQQNLKTLKGINNISITAQTSFDYLTLSPLNNVYETKNNAEKNYTTINKQYTEVKTTTEGVTTQITDITQSIDNNTGEIETIKSNIYDLQQTTAGMEQTLTQQGGSNLLLNSSGLFDNEYWEGTVKSLTNTDIQNNFIAKSCFSLQNGTAKQSIKVINGAYYIGFKYQKLIELANCKLKINDVEVDLTNTSLTEVDKIVNVSEHSITIELISNTNDACLVGDIIVVQGTKQSWSSNMNEIYTATVKIGIGLEIISNTMNTKLLANADGVRIVSNNNNEVVAEFTDMGMTTKEITANKGKIAGLLIQQVGNQVWLSNITGGG